MEKESVVVRVLIGGIIVSCIAVLSVVIWNYRNKLELLLVFVLSWDSVRMIVYIVKNGKSFY